MTQKLTDTAAFDRPLDPDTNALAVCRELNADRPTIAGLDPFRLWRTADGVPSTNVPHRFVHHSPEGFEWGYGGCGPADLSLNMLAEFVPLWEAWRLHHAFKWAVVAAAPPNDGITISRDSVAQWIESVWAHEDQLNREPDRSMYATIAKVAGCLGASPEKDGKGDDMPPLVTT